MLKFRQWLAEVLDHKPEELKHEPNPDGYFHRYNFKVKGDHVRLRIAHHDEDDGRIGDVQFTTKSGSDKGTTYGSSGTHARDSQHVFGAVHHVLKQHAQEHKVSHYTFGAFGDSRARLYHHFARRIDPDYTHHRSESGASVEYLVKTGVHHGE